MPWFLHDSCRRDFILYFRRSPRRSHERQLRLELKASNGLVKNAVVTSSSTRELVNTVASIKSAKLEDAIRMKCYWHNRIKRLVRLLERNRAKRNRTEQNKSSHRDMCPTLSITTFVLREPAAFINTRAASRLTSQRELHKSDGRRELVSLISHLTLPMTSAASTTTHILEVFTFFVFPTKASAWNKVQYLGRYLTKAYHTSSYS